MVVTMAPMRKIRRFEASIRIGLNPSYRHTRHTLCHAPRLWAVLMRDCVATVQFSLMAVVRHTASQLNVALLLCIRLSDAEVSGRGSLQCRAMQNDERKND